MPVSANGTCVCCNHTVVFCNLTANLAANLTTASYNIYSLPKISSCQDGVVVWCNQTNLTYTNSSKTGGIHVGPDGMQDFTTILLMAMVAYFCCCCACLCHGPHHIVRCFLKCCWEGYSCLPQSPDRIWPPIESAPSKHVLFGSVCGPGLAGCLPDFDYVAIRLLPD